MRREISCGLVAALAMALAVGVGDTNAWAQDRTAQIPDAGCLETASQLSSDQIERLSRGESVALSRNRFDYLVDAAREFAPSNWEDLANDTASHMNGPGPEPDGARLRANVLLLISNSQVRVDDEKAEISDSENEALRDCIDRQGASESIADAGGLDVLPEGLRNGLTEVPIDWVRFLPWESVKPEIRHESELRAVANLMSRSDADLAEGSDIHRALLGRAGEIADVAIEHGTGTFRAPGEFFDFDRHRVGDLLSRIIEAAGRDRLALRDALTGFPETGGDIPGGGYRPFGKGENTELRPSAFQRTTAIPALLAFDWDESAGQDAPLVDALGSIRFSDVIRPPTEESKLDSVDLSASDEVNVEAGQALTRIVMNRSAFLTRIHGYSDSPVGVVNPNVTDALAAATVPHSLSITGRFDDLQGRYIGGVQGSDIEKLAMVLSTGDEARTTLVSTAVDMISMIQQEYLSLSPSDIDSKPIAYEQIDAVRDHGRLERSVEWGTRQGLRSVAESDLRSGGDGRIDGSVYYSSENSAVHGSDQWFPIEFETGRPALALPSGTADRLSPRAVGRMELATRIPDAGWLNLNLILGAEPGSEVAKSSGIDRLRLDPDEFTRTIRTSDFRIAAMAATSEEEMNYEGVYQSAVYHYH